MQRRKKQLLGFLGLAFVVAMTIFAYAMPAPGASAINSETTRVKVQVVTEGDVPTVEILSLSNDDIVLKRSFTVKISYSKATELKIFVKNNGAIATTAEQGDNGEPVDLTGSTCENITFDEGEQTCEVEYHLPGDLTDPSGVSFVTRAIAINGNASNASNEDAVAFMYRSAYLLDFGGEYVSNGDPIMEAKIGEDVKSAYIEVYDKNGKRVEIPANDGNGHYKLDLGQMEGDSLKFALPLWEAGAAAGEYKVVLLAYDTETPTEDGLVALATKENIKYEVKNTDKPGDDNKDPNVPGGPNNPNNPDRPGGPNNPDDPNRPTVPDTGSIFSDLNISRADYIVTGLVAFGVVTGFAFFLILRRNKR